MTESEWLSSTDLQAMLDHLRYVTYEVPTYGGTATQSRHPPLISDRKLRLFAVACCRRIWHLMTDPRSRAAVEAVERYADLLITVDELAAARAAARVAAEAAAGAAARAAARAAAGAAAWVAAEAAAWVAARAAARAAAEAAAWAAAGAAAWVAARAAAEAAAGAAENKAQAALLRDIIGNPWRPVCIIRPMARGGPEYSYERGEILTPTVLAVAAAIYDERRFEDMPILADALEDAGCENEAILEHCRGMERCQACVEYGIESGTSAVSVCGGYFPGCVGGWVPIRGPHVRGCFVLDLILGKE